MTNILSIVAIILAGLAAFYATFNKTQTIETTGDIVCNECIELSKAVEELKIEIKHLHEVDIEIGDNLNERINQVSGKVDALGSTIGSISADAAEAATIAASAAAERAEAAAAKSGEYYQRVVDFFANLKLPKLPGVSWPWGGKDG